MPHELIELLTEPKFLMMFLSDSNINDNHPIVDTLNSLFGSLLDQYYGGVDSQTRINFQQTDLYLYLRNVVYIPAQGKSREFGRLWQTQALNMMFTDM